MTAIGGIELRGGSSARRAAQLLQMRDGQLVLVLARFARAGRTIEAVGCGLQNLCPLTNYRHLYRTIPDWKRQHTSRMISPLTIWRQATIPNRGIASRLAPNARVLNRRRSTLVSWFRSSPHSDIDLLANFETKTTLGINTLLVSFRFRNSLKGDIEMLRISESGH